MYRKLTIFLLLFATVAMVGCKSGNTSEEETTRKKTVRPQETSVSQSDEYTPPYDFAVKKSDIEHGELTLITYPSTTVGVDRKAYVYTPPEYSEDKQYSVLYVLHGIGGTEAEWISNGLPANILDNLYANNELADMIVVFPNGRAMVDDSANGDIYASDKVDGFAKFEQDLLVDLIPYMEKTYPLIKDRENRGICGLSMGGGQSLNFGLGNLDIFSYVGAFSPAPNTKEAASLIPSISDANEKLNLLWISCGTSDGLLYISQRTDDYLTKQGVNHIYYTLAGNHDWNVWKNSLYNFAKRVFTTDLQK